MTETVQPFSLHSTDAGRPSKWQRYYAPQHNEEAVLALTTTSSGDDGGANNGGPEHVAVARDDMMVPLQDTDANPEPDESLIAEIPALVRRLNTLWQRRGEMPPAYEG